MANVKSLKDMEEDNDDDKRQAYYAGGNTQNGGGRCAAWRLRLADACTLRPTRPSEASQTLICAWLSDCSPGCCVAVARRSSTRGSS